MSSWDRKPVFGTSGHTKESLKLGKMPFPCQLLCASSTAQTWLTVTSGTQGLPRKQDAMTQLCKCMRCAAHQETKTVLREEASMRTVSTNSVLRPHLKPLVLGGCRNGKDPGSSHKELLWLPSGWVQPHHPSTPVLPHPQGTHWSTSDEVAILPHMWSKGILTHLCQSIMVSLHGCNPSKRLI